MSTAHQLVANFLGDAALNLQVARDHGMRKWRRREGAGGPTWRLDRRLNIHPELDHIQKELQQVLVLRITTLHREREERLAVAQRETWGKRDARTLARLNDIERVVHAVGSLITPCFGGHIDGELAGDDSLLSRARAVCHDLRVVQIFVGETGQRLCVEIGSLTQNR